MKDITITRQVFALDELDPAARCVAIEKLRTENYENIPSDMISEGLNGELVNLLTGEWVGDTTDKELKRLSGLTLEWRLGYCQGDGVAIYGEIYNDYATQLTWGNAVYAKLTRNSHGHHYAHPNCFTVELFDGDSDIIKDDDAIADELRDICTKLERYGYAEIEHYTSEPYVIELLNDNDTPRIFNADGTLAPSQFWAADTVKCVVCLTDIQVSGDDGHICSHCEYNL